MSVAIGQYPTVAARFVIRMCAIVLHKNLENQVN